MAWIESHTVLIRHRKLITLATDLRIRPVYLLGHLHTLWHNVLEQQENGDLSSWSDDLIADLSCFTGDAPQYVKLLTTHRWLTQDRKVHDWLDYAGMYLIKKYNTSNREKLIDIWALHGRLYGRDPTESKQRVGRERLETLPNLTKPNLPKDLSPPAINGHRNVLKPLTNVQKIVEGWKILNGVKREDKVWDRVHFAMNAKFAKELLHLFDDSVNPALDCMENVFDRLKARGLDISLRGIVKNSDVYRQMWLEKKAKVGV